jgi:probable rRNA maturation factor
MNAVVVHRDVVADSPDVPDARSLKDWVTKSLDAAGRNDGEVTIRVVDEAEITALNETYRGKSQATNVLSFTAEMPVATHPRYLGDVVISAPVVRREARQQGKTVQAHWAHLVVHGVLHLLGYDHVAGDDAAGMEDLEREILAEFGYADPYT